MVQSALALAIACIHGLVVRGHDTWADGNTHLQILGGHAHAFQDTAHHGHHVADSSNGISVLRGSAKLGKGGPLGTISLNINLDIAVGAQAGAAHTDYRLVSVDRLLPARENLQNAFECYDKDDNHIIVHGELEMQDLHRDVAALVNSNDIANKLMQEADFHRDGDLDELEFLALLDTICWHLKIKICTKLASGRHLQCKGAGAGGMQMLGSPEGLLADAHADLDASFKCFDLDGNGKLSKEELAELIEHLKTSLYFSNEQVARALKESDWGMDGFGELQFDCLLVLLQRSVKNIKLDVH